MPQNVSAQFVCRSPKILTLNEKRLPQSVVQDMYFKSWASYNKPHTDWPYLIVLVFCFQFDSNNQLGIVMFLQALKCVSSLDKNRQNQSNDARTSEEMDRTVLKIALKCEVEGGSNYNTGLEESGWFGLVYFILQVYPSNLQTGYKS